MSKKEAKEVKTTEAKPQDDNLVDVLNDFNADEEGSSEDVDTKQAKGETAEVEDSESENWLINNKFKNTEEGATELAKAYKELQSKSDIKINDLSDKVGRLGKLEQLDKVLSDSPTVVQAMQDELVRLRNGALKSPEKPEDYDILDETIEGTSSYKWRQEYDTHLVEQGKTAAKEEVDNLRQEIAQKDASRARIAKLQKLGMDSKDIKDYYSFMTEKKNLTDDNLVPIWRILSGREDLSTTNQGSPSNINPETKRVSAAAVEGKAPEQLPDTEKAKDAFWNDIMKSAKK